MQDDPLVVPAHRASRALEQIGRGNILPAKSVDDGVVKAAEGEVELSHHHVRVVSRIADDGGALRVSLQVVGPADLVPAEEELGRIVDIEEIRITGRSSAVEELEIDLLPARVSQRRYSAWWTRAERSAVMSWATNCPKKGQPAASWASSVPFSANGAPSHAPPCRPNA